jgi:hypothetical protein
MNGDNFLDHNTCVHLPVGPYSGPERPQWLSTRLTLGIRPGGR